MPDASVSALSVASCSFAMAFSKRVNGRPSAFEGEAAAEAAVVGEGRDARATAAAIFFCCSSSSYSARFWLYWIHTQFGQSRPQHWPSTGSSGFWSGCWIVQKVEEVGEAAAGDGAASDASTEAPFTAPAAPVAACAFCFARSFASMRAKADIDDD